MTESAGYQPRAGDPAEASAWTHLTTLSAAMLEKLEECRRERGNPPVEAVHRLRTGARRVEAMLELIARRARAGGLAVDLETGRRRWLRQLKRVRRAAGAVRDLDVHRELLASNFLPQRPLDAGWPDTEPPLAGPARALDAWLAEHRITAAAAMAHVLDRRVTRLHTAGQRFLGAVEEAGLQPRGGSRHGARWAARVALEDSLRLADAMPLLDRENLHDFRKGAKKARYVTESEPEDAAAQALGRAIKRMQDAIGAWHDWEVLAGEARQALGEEGDLQRELLAREQQAYAHALRVTHAANRRLVGEWRALHPRRRMPARSRRPGAAAGLE